MLLPVADGPALTDLIRTTIADIGTPAVSTTDSAGRRHDLWPIGPGDRQDTLLAAVQRHPLLVADGNHRVAAASHLPSLLALVTAGPDLHIGAINRCLHDTGLTLADLIAAWHKTGLTTRAPEPPSPGTIRVDTPTGSISVDLPPPDPDEPLPRIDHATVENVLIKAAIGIDPEGPHVRPVPANRTPTAGYDAVLHIAPVPFADVLRVHEQGRRMPRKSTYFTPKPRSGLFLADLTS
jgi:hypothetical protein